MQATEVLHGEIPAGVSFPYTYTKHSIAVKIYRTPCRGYDSFTLVYYQDGARKRGTFASFDAALAQAEEVAKRLGKDVDVLELRSADRASYLRARQILDPLGVSLEVAVSQYAHAREVLGAVPIATAAEFYAQRHGPRFEARPVGKVIRELLEAKRGDRCSERYLKTLEYSLRKFEKRFGGNIGEVTGQEMDDWLRGSGLAPRTRNNIRTALHTLFEFARAKRYVPKDHEELQAVAIANDRDGDIEVFTPAEMVEILGCASERMVPFLVLGGFAGIRHAEVQRLDWRDIDLEDGVIELRAAKAKTASRRTVPVLPNLREWLQEHREESGLVVAHRNVAFELHMIVKRANQARRAAWAKANGVSAEELERVSAEVASATKAPRRNGSQKGEVAPGAETAEAEGWQPFVWKHNGLRHSFISYRVADIQNIPQVAMEAGNSTQMIHKHYRELVRPKAAKEWFGITPGVVAEAKGKAAV